MTQEFHLRVTALGANEVYVRVDRGPLGTPLAEERLNWPVDEWLQSVRQILSDPLALSTIDPLTLGQSLYRSLFQGSLGQSWNIAQGIAQHRREILRLRLGVRDETGSPNRLQSLPWEILHDGHSPLTTAQSVIFSRYQPRFADLNHFSTLAPSHSPRTPLKGGEPSMLRVLMVLAEPLCEQNKVHLALKQEALALRGELNDRANETSPLAIELTLLEQPGREQLTQALEQGQYHIFHFSGHSSPGALHLVNRKTGLTERLPGEDLAGLLRNNGVSLALLNSCRGHYTEPNQPELKPNLADVLVQAGLPAVLAMAEQIPDRVAVTLTRLFYRNLKLGYPIDLSLCRARQGLLSSYGSEYFYWCLPVLYLRSDFDGQLIGSGHPVSPAVEEHWLESPAMEVSDLALEGIENPAIDPFTSVSPWNNLIRESLDPLEIVESLEPLTTIAENVPENVPENPGALYLGDPYSVGLYSADSDPGEQYSAGSYSADPDSADSGAIESSLLAAAEFEAANSSSSITTSLYSDPLSPSVDRSGDVLQSSLSGEEILDDLPLPSEPEAQRWLAQLSILGESDEEEPVLSIEERLLPDMAASHPDSSRESHLYPDLPEDSVPVWGGGEFLARSRTASLLSQGRRDSLGESPLLLAPPSEISAPVSSFLDTEPQDLQQSNLHPPKAQTPDPENQPAPVFHLAESATVTLYRQMLALNPTDSRTYYKLGLSLVQAGQLEEGIEAYQQSLTFNPNEAAVYSSLGTALCRMGQYRNAIVAYRQSIALNPQLPEVYRLLAIALAKQGKEICFPSAQRSTAMGMVGTVGTISGETSIVSMPSSSTLTKAIVPAGSNETALPNSVTHPWLHQEQFKSPWGIPLWVWLISTSVTAIATLSFLFSGAGAIFHPVLSPWKSNPSSNPSGIDSSAIDSSTLNPSTPNPTLSPPSNVSSSAAESQTASPVPALEGNQAIMTYALESIQQQKWTEGEEALRSLLERSALAEAQTVLTASGNEALSRPELSFLYGRLAWQAVQSGEGNFSLEDARRYWESASQQNPESTVYLNALAFAYYHLGQVTTAKQIWLQVLPLEGDENDPLFANGNPLGGRFPEVAPIPTNEGLTASAGLGLALWRLGITQPVGQQSQFLNQSSQLYHRVMENSPESFSIQQLSQNWLWTEQAIQDWQDLGQVAGTPTP